MRNPKISVMKLITRKICQCSKVSRFFYFLGGESRISLTMWKSFSKCLRRLEWKVAVAPFGFYLERCPEVELILLKCPVIVHEIFWCTTMRFVSSCLLAAFYYTCSTLIDACSTSSENGKQAFLKSKSSYTGDCCSFR